MGYTSNQNSDDISSVLQNRHSINKSEQSIKKHKCFYPDCHATFLRPSRLQRHIRSHTGERPYVCSQPGCTKSYTNSSHLKRHLETHNPAKKVYQCTQCSKIISNLHNLKRHYKHIHSEDKKISCGECGETFNKRHQLAKHQTIHSGLTFIKCNKCMKSFMNLNKFKQHQKTHEKGPKSYSCPVSGCSEIFDKWMLLCAHRKAKHVIDYKCDKCNKTFLGKSQLKIHSKIHFENRIVIQCLYDKCHKSYLSKSNLEEHVKICHLGKRFYCDICSVGLTAKRRLIEHIQRHHEPKKKKKLSKAQRKKRKDAGVPKKSIISGLIGVNLPNNLEKLVMERETAISEELKK